MAELSKKLSERWKALSEEEREPFKKLAIEDKLRVEQAQIAAGVFKVSKRTILPSKDPKLPAGWRKQFDHSLAHDIYVHLATKTVLFIAPNETNVPPRLLVPPVKKTMTPFQIFCRKHSKEAQGKGRKERAEFLRRLFDEAGQKKEGKKEEEEETEEEEFDFFDF